MKPLSSLLNPRLIQEMREACSNGEFPRIQFKDAMEFMLTDGIIPRSGLPAASFLKLEDWVRARDEPGRLDYTASELKNKTGEILEQVIRGKNVRILKHGRPVAELKKLD